MLRSAARCPRQRLAPGEPSRHRLTASVTSWRCERGTRDVRIFLLSTAVAPLGSGLGGGVEHMVVSAARELEALGLDVTLLAPESSRAEVSNLVTVPGRLAVSAVSCRYEDSWPQEADGFLATALRWLSGRAARGDVILNFSYDWLPLYISDFLSCPLGTLVSVGSLNRSMDVEIERLSRCHPERLAFVSHAQVASFSLKAAVRLIPPGVDLNVYRFNAHPCKDCCWLGRIAPEKGLEDVFAAAARSGRAVTVFGVMQDASYWERLVRAHPAAPVRYGGFLRPPALAEAVRDFRVMLMTPKWLEAFGIVGIEALACGTPVVAYRRGGVSEYVVDGETGWLVEPDDLDELCAAVDRAAFIERPRCRALVERRFTLAHYRRALLNWLHDLLGDSGSLSALES